jgi:DNA-binding NarL/FixJ family response regulator
VRVEDDILKRIRVLVANQPRLMRELVLATIADQPDIDVVGEVGNASELTAAIEESQPDALILELDEFEKGIAQCGFLLGRYPQMRILALAPEENRGTIYWAIVEVRTKPLESSEAGILSALRERPSLLGALRS